MIFMRARAIIECPSFRCSEAIAPHLKRVFEGEYDLPLCYNAEPPTILDLGANYGSFAVWASHRWPGAHIHCYEPHPETFAVLQENLAIYPKVYAHNYAIGNPGMRVLINGQENTGESSLYLQQNQTDFTGQHVEVRDPLQLPEAQILKMDIEGCELEVLEPLMAAGRKFDAIMFEYHRQGDRRKLDALLGDYVLTGAYLYNPGLGVMRYLRRDLVAGSDL